MFDVLRRSREPINGNGNGVSRRQLPDWPDPASPAGDRMQIIVEAATRVATEVREEAEAQARRYVEEARRRAEALTSERVRVLHETSNALLEQGRMVMAHTDELVRALHDAADRIGAATSAVKSSRESALETGNQAPPEPAAPALRTSSPESANRPLEEPLRDPEPDVTDDDPPALSGLNPDASEDPRLLARKMAVAGSSRRQVEARLREIGVEDPVGLVDAAFGEI